MYVDDANFEKYTRSGSRAFSQAEADCRNAKEGRRQECARSLDWVLASMC